MTAVEGASKLLSSEEKSEMKASSSAESTAGERDIFREIPLRYAGYANEVGEAFRHMVPLRCVHLSYAISSGYVVSHAIAQGISTRRNKLRTASKTRHQKSSSSSNNYSLTNHNNFSSSPPASELNYINDQSCRSLSSTKSLSPTAAVLDTLLWQGLASVAIPGLLINRLCAGSRVLLNRYAVRLLSQQVRSWAVTGIGLASIPMIIHPIDWAVDKFMDSLIRPHYADPRNHDS